MSNKPWQWFCTFQRTQCDAIRKNIISSVKHLLWGKYSMPNVATGIKSNCVLKGLINIKITKALIFLMSICAVHIEFHVRWNSVDPLKHSCLDKVGSWTTILVSTDETTKLGCFLKPRCFQISIYRLGSAQFGLRSDHTSFVILTAYFIRVVFVASHSLWRMY
jgi:hypothetical protein